MMLSVTYLPVKVHVGVPARKTVFNGESRIAKYENTINRISV